MVPWWLKRVLNTDISIKFNLRMANEMHVVRDLKVPRESLV